MPNKDEELKNDQPTPEAPKKPKAKVEADKVASSKKTDTKAETSNVSSAKAEMPDKETETVVVKGNETLEPKATDSKVASTSGSSTSTGSDQTGRRRFKLPAVRNVKGTIIKVVAVLVALVAIAVIVFGVLIYVYKSESSVVTSAAKVIPYPAERVNGHFVSYSDYLFEVDANKRAYQNNAKLNNQPAVDFNSADGKKLVTQIKQHALEKLESDALTAQLANQKKVKVTDKEVNDLINQLYDRYGGKDTLLKTLDQIYGWNLNDLKGVVRKQLLAKNLEEKVTSDPAVDTAAKAKAQDVLAKVKDNGDFAALAKQYSQASDAASGGDLGFFTKGQLPDNLQAAAEALQPNQVSDVIKTEYGYEIIKVVEKKDDGSIHGLHILVKTVDFTEYFQNELKKAKVNTYIKV